MKTKDEKTKEAGHINASYWGSRYWEGSAYVRKEYLSRTEKSLLTEAIKHCKSAQDNMIGIQRCMSALEANFKGDFWLIKDICEQIRQVVGSELAHSIRLIMKGRGYQAKM